MSSKKIKVFLLIGICLSILGDNVWNYLWEGLYFQTKFIYILLLLSIIKEAYKEDKWINAITTISFWCFVSDIIKDIFFDPIENTYWDFIYVGIVATYTINLKIKNT